MDILRDPFDASEAQTGPIGADGDEPLRPARDERRMQVRAYNLWASLLGQRQFPAIDSLAIEGAHGFGPRAVLLRFASDEPGDIEAPRIAWLGSDLASEAGMAPLSCEKDGERGDTGFAAIPPRSLLSRITDHYLQILANRAPIGFEAEFVNAAGATILYRGILLPFSNDDRRIDHIFGVINWKEAGAQARTAGDPAPDAALDAPTPRHGKAPVALADWADGPGLSAAEPDYTPNDATNLSTALLGPGMLGSDVLDLSRFAIPDVGFGHDSTIAARSPETASSPDTAPGNDTLDGRLSAAREQARCAREGEQRSHRALYEALGEAWNLALAADRAPDDYARLLSDAGITAQARAPLTALAKLVFGSDYDKSRLTEIATVLAHARRLGLAEGALPAFLLGQDGGIKAVVQAERAARRTEPRPATAKRSADAQLRRTLEGVNARPIAQALAARTMAAQDGEFAVVLTRRLENGEIVVVGDACADADLLRRTARIIAR